MQVKELMGFIADQVDRDIESITMDTRLDELGIDSMRAIVLFYDLEERFGLDIPNEVFETADTVGDVVQQLGQLENNNGDA